jgi:UDP-N-acetylglucosamine 2-epimerase
MILLAYGTRPEYIKIKPLINEMAKRNIKFKTLFTGQHEDIVASNPDLSIYIPKDGTNRLDTILSSCMNLPDEFFNGIQYILVQGDTTSVVGLSLSAMHRKIKLIHMEAGLRTYDSNNPFPEENNRRIVSSIADIHLCPTELNKDNLIKENVTGEIFVVGNTGLDNLVYLKRDCEYTNKVLVTLHRRENIELITEWFEEINKLAKFHPELNFILPMHPNPKIRLHRNILKYVNVIEPLNHSELLSLLVKCRIVITDSGGLQEECSFLNKRCVVCRKTTERPESLGFSTELVKSPKQLQHIFEYCNDNHQINVVSPYGDGYSSIKIIDILSKLI